MTRHFGPARTLGLSIALAVTGCGSSVPTTAPTASAGATTAVALPSPSVAGTIHVIGHVVVIMQENRSFDTYFGTYPGADGIPMANGQPSVCVPDPARGGCDVPFHMTADSDSGGPHGQVNAAADIAGGACSWCRAGRPSAATRATP